MDLAQNWRTIRHIVQNALRTSNHCSFATVTADGRPHVTPIGSLILRDDCTGYYFEEYPKQMPENFNTSNRVSILAVNSGFLFWFRAIRSGRFPQFPGVRLHGTVGDRRSATNNEIAAWQRVVKPFRRTKGYKILWENLQHVRDIEFDSFETIISNQMTTHL